MYKWSQNWQLLFNFTKCKCLHIGYNNPNYDYFMGDVHQESIDMEKDLGVHIHKSLKVKEQINYVVKKANRILGTIRRTYTDKSVKNIKNLYITLVRPIIENCQQAWCPHLQKDIDNLESVQRGATKMITGISKLPYYLRLQKCGLLSLQDSRKRADMLEVFTIINRFTDIDTRREYSSLSTPWLLAVKRTCCVHLVNCGVEVLTCCVFLYNHYIDTCNTTMTRQTDHYCLLQHHNDQFWVA